MKNILGATLATISRLKEAKDNGELAHISRIIETPEFDRLLNGKGQVIDGALYVYPNGGSTLAQRSHGTDSKEQVGVGIAITFRSSLIGGDTSYLVKLGEAYASIRNALDEFSPVYNEQKFFIPKDGSKDADDRYIIGDGFVFITFRYLYNTIL